MTLAALISTHGYWILALGCLLEGETVLVLAGFAAHRGYLSLPIVLVVASMAGFAGDTLFFWLGRRYGSVLIDRFPGLRRQLARVQPKLARYGAGFVIGIRFAYGLRIAGPAALGMTEMSAARYALLNAVGAVVWACAIAGIGWAFGQAAEALLGEIRHLEGWLLLGILGCGVLVWLMRGQRGTRGNGSTGA